MLDTFTINMEIAQRSQLTPNLWPHTPGEHSSELRPDTLLASDGGGQARASLASLAVLSLASLAAGANL